jgi:putative spermidine/putrescine transport system substrate-binding protein
VSKLAAAVKSGQTPDVDVVDTGFATAAAQAGLTEKLSADKIPELGSVNADALAAYQGAAVPYRGSSVLLAYDSSQVASPPKTLADLLAWIKANPGKFTYNTPDSGGSGYSFAETVVASKMSADVVKKMQTDYVPDSEGEWSAGLDELKSLTPAIYQNVYPNGNQAVLDLLTKGEIAMAPVWSDQFLSAQSQGQLGEEFKVAQISDPSFTGGAAYIALIKGSKHADAGNAFISWLLQPAQQAEMVTKISAFPAIPLSKLPADVQSSFAGVDTQDLRANFNSKLQADFKQKWAATVPG